MEMQLKNKLLTLSIILCSMFISGQQYDFFNKKYSNEYTLIIDESHISDHPIYSYLDCKKEGYLTVHFIPKKESLKNYWKNFYKGKDFSNSNPKKESKKIKTIVLKNFDNYYIYCYQYEASQIDKDSYCTFESFALKKEPTAKIYAYDINLKKWDFIKQDSTDGFYPPYHNSDFFIKLRTRAEVDRKNK